MPKMQVIVSIISHNPNQDTINGFNIEIAEAPDLVGTEKQIVWALKIREAAIKDAVGFIIERTKVGDRPLKSCVFHSSAVDVAIAKVNEGCAQLASRLTMKTTARSWIDAAPVSGKGSFLTIQKILRA